MKLRNNKGFTLVEIAIVLTIVGLIIGGIWAAASTVFNNNKAQAFSKELIQIVQNTKGLFAGQGSAAVGTGFTLVIANNSGVFPSEMISSAGTAAAPVIVTPFAVSPAAPGDVAVSGVTASTVGYTISNLPQAACTQALMTLGTANNLTKLGITDLEGTTAADISGMAAGGPATPVTTVTAGTACNAAGNTNTIKFAFNLF